MRRTFKVNPTKNKSITYMLPFLNEQVPFRFRHLMQNTYLSCDKDDELFCVMYKWSSDEKFKEFEGEIMNSHLFVSHTDYGDRVVYKFRLTRNMDSGRVKFIAGEYKDFSEDHKLLITDYLKLIGVSNLQQVCEVLDKNSKTTSSPPSMESETLEGNIVETSIVPSEKFI